ncbi:transposase [Chryseobacterium flavum]|uniref:Transposase n=1 Tax=Chryseobacterium flavum TaxID=415851 RepID=A0A3D9CMB2_9FLAO|nr:transposase [Chryseobacterium flavum]REC66885.1 transposase [Chryseobacterium flavum]
MDFREINIRKLIKTRVEELEIPLERICEYLGNDQQEIQKYYMEKSIDCHLLLKWSKLLEYDFFRVYSQHLILYAPVKRTNIELQSRSNMSYTFRKKLYTSEIIDFVIEQYSSGVMTKRDIIQRYKIPKTTLYKWLVKYHHNKKK